MMADGSQRRRLTHTRESDGGPAFSPSGRRIVFTRQRFQAGDPLGIDIYKMRADGSGVHRITRTGNSAARGWSPDGSHILAEVGSTVTLLKPDGSNAEPVVEPPPGAFDQGPDLAPSGRRIVFARDYDDPRRLQIYIVRTDGTHLRRIDNSPAHDQEPVFAPSGGRIAFESDRRRPHGTFEICTMRADGSNVTRLTRAYPRASAGLPSWGVRP